MIKMVLEKNPRVLKIAVEKKKTKLFSKVGINTVEDRGVNMGRRYGYKKSVIPHTVLRDLRRHSNDVKDLVTEDRMIEQDQDDVEEEGYWELNPRFDLKEKKDADFIFRKLFKTKLFRRVYSPQFLRTRAILRSGKPSSIIGYFQYRSLVRGLKDDLRLELWSNKRDIDFLKDRERLMRSRLKFACRSDVYRDTCISSNKGDSFLAETPFYLEQTFQQSRQVRKWCRSFFDFLKNIIEDPSKSRSYGVLVRNGRRHYGKKVMRKDKTGKGYIKSKDSTIGKSTIGKEKPKPRKKIISKKKTKTKKFKVKKSKAKRRLKLRLHKFVLRYLASKSPLLYELIRRKEILERKIFTKSKYRLNLCTKVYTRIRFRVNQLECRLHRVRYLVKEEFGNESFVFDRFNRWCKYMLNKVIMVLRRTFYGVGMKPSIVLSEKFFELRRRFRNCFFNKVCLRRNKFFRGNFSKLDFFRLRPSFLIKMCKKYKNLRNRIKQKALKLNKKKALRLLIRCSRKYRRAIGKIKFGSNYEVKPIGSVPFLRASKQWRIYFPRHGRKLGLERLKLLIKMAFLPKVCNMPTNGEGVRFFSFCRGILPLPITMSRTIRKGLFYKLVMYYLGVEHFYTSYGSSVVVPHDLEKLFPLYFYRSYFNPKRKLYFYPFFKSIRKVYRAVKSATERQVFMVREEESPAYFNRFSKIFF